MEEKLKKKQEEAEMKEARKRERAEKKLQKEAETKRKAEEKLRKAAEKRVAQEEKEAEKKRKAEAREAERKRKAGLKAQKRPLRSQNKENVPRESHQADGVDPTPASDGNVSNAGDQSVCAVCMGSYEDDITDGVLQKEWVRCMNTSCGLWMHCDCLSTEDNSYVCYICNVVFK